MEINIPRADGEKAFFIVLNWVPNAFAMPLNVETGGPIRFPVDVNCIPARCSSNSSSFSSSLSSA